jgi:hypothetical protein
MMRTLILAVIVLASLRMTGCSGFGGPVCVSFAVEGRERGTLQQKDLFDAPGQLAYEKKLSFVSEGNFEVVAILEHSRNPVLPSGKTEEFNAKARARRDETTKQFLLEITFRIVGNAIECWRDGPEQKLLWKHLLGDGDGVTSVALDEFVEASETCERKRFAVMSLGINRVMVKEGGESRFADEWEALFEIIPARRE